MAGGEAVRFKGTGSHSTGGIWRLRTPPTPGIMTALSMLIKGCPAPIWKTNGTEHDVPPPCLQTSTPGFRTGPRLYEGAAVEAGLLGKKNREIRGKFGGNSCLNHPSEECPGGGNILQVHYFTMTSLKYAPDGARTTLINYQKALGQRRRRGGGDS